MSQEYQLPNDVNPIGPLFEEFLFLISFFIFLFTNFKKQWNDADDVYCDDDSPSLGPQHSLIIYFTLAGFLSDKEEVLLIFQR